jgi:signal transduction histidine kinase/DNA-binding response OmpR family regulator
VTPGSHPARPRMRWLALRTKLVAAISLPMLLVLGGIVVALRGLQSVEERSDLELAAAIRSSEATQRVLVSTLGEQLAGTRLLTTRTAGDFRRLDDLADAADRVRRQAMREGSLSEGQRSALLRLARLQRAIETQIARISIAQDMGLGKPGRASSVVVAYGDSVRNTTSTLGDEAARALKVIAALGDSVEGAMSTYRDASDAQRAVQQAASKAAVARVRTQVVLISVAAVLGAILATVLILDRYARARMVEAELRLAKDAAEDTSRLKSDFLATMSHEIRTPMNGVVGMIGLVLQRELTGEQRRHLETARSSAEALMVILNDILDFSKIEAGKIELESIPFALPALLEEVTELMASRAHDKGLELVLRVPADVPQRVLGDPGRLRQVLINLIGNAIKFTESGYVLIEATDVTGLEPETIVRFAVRDTGIGIAPERRQHLFQKFTQADSSTTRRFGGTGLGLAISRQLVTLMGGRLALSSTLDVGSTFAFSVPMPLDRSGPPRPVPPGELRNVRVLVVDDVDVNRTVLCEQAISWGMKADEAADASTALSMAREAAAAKVPYAIALVDHLMPGTDGEQFARLVRDDPALHGMDLVLLTSSILNGNSAHFTAAGFAACFVKPVRPAQLLNALAAIRGAAERGVKLPRLITRDTIEELVVRPASDLVGSRSRTDAVATTGRGRRVLVAEDNVVNTLFVVTLLQRAGWDVTAEANGQAAVDRHFLRPFDVILMDCEMPELDGFGATERIREGEGVTRHTPIIAMTATAMQGDRERCLAAGMDDYVSKPIVDFNALLATLDRWALEPSGASGP